jgi:hypothetical protein
VAKALRTRQSTWSAVFREVVAQFARDEEVRRVVGPHNIRSWAGVPDDKAPLIPTGTAPVVRFTPEPRNVTWYSPCAQYGMLRVRVELAVASLCIDDVLDLWDLVVSAIGPGSTPGFSTSLVPLGAETGEIQFTDPTIDPFPAADPEGLFLATGYFQLAVIRPIHPGP